MVSVSIKGKEVLVDSNIGGVVRNIQDNFSGVSLLSYGLEEALMMLNEDIITIRETERPQYMPADGVAGFIIKALTP